MPVIFAPVPAIVKPVAASPALINAALLDAWLADRSTIVPTDELIDDSWPLSDAEADWLAAEAASYAAYEAGIPLW